MEKRGLEYKTLKKTPTKPNQTKHKKPNQS